MKKLIISVFVLVALAGFVFSQTAPKGRALAIEDYYKIKTAGSPEISPDGKWVTFTVQTKFEADNFTGTETYVVPSDGSAQPRKIQHQGKDVANPHWTADGMLQYSLNSRVTSAVFLQGNVGLEEPPQGQRGGGNQGPLWKVSVDTPNAVPVLSQPLPSGVMSFDGKWIAQAKDRPRTTATPTYASDFEKRALEHFKGRQFDWMRFQQDGQELPTPDPRLRPVAEITITPAGGGEAKELTKLGMRPTNIAWHQMDR